MTRRSLRMHARRAGLLLAALATVSTSPAPAQVPVPETSGPSAQAVVAGRLLDPMFQDHAVLQRDRSIRVWGTARPGRRVHVRLDAQGATGRADRSGRWEVQLPALPAGGPHVLTATDGTSTQSVGDLLAGDVWLCAGQSNMELPVWRSLDAASELADARAPTVRLLTVPQTASAVPLDALAAAARWQTVDEDSLREFSATCFYFARALQARVAVPMGLVDASWGGSRIEAWIGADALQDAPRFREPLDVLALYHRDPALAAQRWGEVWSRWWDRRAGTIPGDRPWRMTGDASPGWRKAPDALGAWERWNEPALAAFDGMVWFRTTVALTAEQAHRPAVLELGAIDETDMTWVNGQAVGGNYDPGSPRRYPLPAGLLQAGDNRIVVNVLDTWRDGGMSAPASAYRLRFADGSSAALAGWEYRAEAPGASPPGAPWQSAGGLSTLHNGMIAPLGRYGLRGLLWYQGESNTGEAAAYPDLLRRLGAGMRARFGARLPILVVQLAGYGMPPTAPGESGWADVREAQRQVVAGDADMALVVALDIGDRYDIHPPNKQELGRRLARAAGGLVYADARAASGPAAVSATRLGDAVAVRFDGVGGALVAYGAEGPIGFELCSEASDSCRYANATIEGRHVVLRAALPVAASPGAASPGRSLPASPGPASAPATQATRVPHGRAEQPVAPATRVRYGWADNPVVNLFDRDGLPAGPFEITVHDVARRSDQGGHPDAPSTGEHE